MIMTRTLMLNPTFITDENFKELEKRYDLRAPYCGVRDILREVGRYIGPAKLKLRKPDVYKEIRGNVYGILIDIEAPKNIAIYGTLGTIRTHLADLLPESIRNLVPMSLREIINNPDNKVVEVLRTDDGIKIIGSMLEDMER